MSPTVQVEMHERWVAAASVAGLSLSAWVREACDLRAAGPKRVNMFEGVRNAFPIDPPLERVPVRVVEAQVPAPVVSTVGMPGAS